MGRCQLQGVVLGGVLALPATFQGSSQCLGSYIQGCCSAGVVTLLSDYEVCKEGDVLTPEQARVLVSNTTALLPDTK